MLKKTQKIKTLYFNSQSIRRKFDISLTCSSDPSLVTFADSEQIAAWAKPYIAAAAQAGIVNGKGNNRFAPSDTATRAEAVKLVLALLESK